VKPITHAKIRYWAITINHSPMIAYWFIKASWLDWKRDNYVHVHQLEKIEKQREALWEQFNLFIVYREQETKRTFRFHRDGYELVIKL
jgi:hypothetical protein